MIAPPRRKQDGTTSEARKRPHTVTVQHADDGRRRGSVRATGGDAGSVPSIAHIPMPLSRQGSTLMAIVAQLTAEHAAQGGTRYAVLSDNRGVSVAGGADIYVDYTRHCPRQWFNRREIAIDYAAGLTRLRRPYCSNLYRPAVEAVAQRDVDVALLYEGTYAATSLPLWAALRPKTRIILYVHNALSRSYTSWELRTLLRQSDAVVVCGEHMRSDLERRVKRLPVPVHVIPNGVDDVFFRPSHTSRSPGDACVAMFAGQVAQHKAPHLMLAAAVHARDIIGRPVRLRVVGRSAYSADDELTAYESSLRSFAVEHDLDVDFVSPVDKAALRELYASADVVCVPSAGHEAFGLVAAEAMACGTPVVASALPGLIETCGDAALYFPPGDTGALGRLLARLSEQPELWRTHAVAGTARAVRYTWKKTYDGLRGVVRDVTR